MTTYIMSLGYMSGNTTSHTPESAWEKMKEATLSIIDTPMAIYNSAFEFGAPESDTLGNLYDYALALSSEGAVIFLEENDGGHDVRQVILHCSGTRNIKEHVRRAFCRLLINAMHREGIEVNLRVG